jgi:hypothetical protein
MLLPLCDRVTVYGFGVEGMANRKTDDAFGYHYYKGVGMRHVGDDVHCFDCEEKALQQMGAEGVIDFCTYDPDDTMYAPRRRLIRAIVRFRYIFFGFVRPRDGWPSFSGLFKGL